MKRIFKQMYPYILPYKTHVIWNVIYSLLYAFFGTLAFVTLIPMLSVLFDKTRRVLIEPKYTGITNIKDYASDLLSYKLTLYTNSNQPEKALLLTIILIIATFFLKNIVGYLSSYHMMHLRNGVSNDVRKMMFNKIISLPIPFFSERRKGDVMTRMLGDIGEVQNSFFAILDLIIKEPLTIIFSIVTMFYISTKLTLFVFIFLPISGLIISRIGKSLKSKSLQVQNESGNLISVVEETLTGLKVVKAYNAEPLFKAKFGGILDRILKLSNSIGSKNNLASPMSEFMGIVTIATLLWYGGHLVLIDKSIDGSVFITYMGLAYNILTPAKAITKASYALKNGLAAADRVFEIIDEPNTIANKPNAITKEDFKEKITLENINFAYQEENVLKNFSIEVPKGKTVALVGQSGSGKSTIANLLTRFYDVQSGAIKVDDIDIKDMTVESLRGLLGIVTQDSILFNDSIKNNLLIGKPDASDEEIINALKIANAYEFVKDLAEGIHTNIGDAGGRLSGGQKQRLSIARAVLKNPPIMILDEATSALDTESEKHVQVALENMMQNRTSIVIAHRLSTIQKADNIVVMQKGEIVEQGTHDELLNKNGTYAKLVSMQSFE
ncbi:ABC transporter ATP-binding protein [Flavobacterium sp.]|uniref:ABC transporter ATP-binding protein n=1 Tax=Flavobacterium sp. TaxID=239 RepID=UPI003D0C2438